MTARGAQKILLSVKFRRNSAKRLSISELTKLRKDSEIQVSKKEIPSFGIQANEIRLGGAKVLHDNWIGRRNVGINSPIPSDFTDMVNEVCLSLKR
jgi:hypothetical protein